MIVVKAQLDLTPVEFIKGDNIVVINKDLDISNFEVIHINLYYDGFNICAVLSGYNYD